MVEIKLHYQGDLHCEAIHGPSGRTLETDAPVDNQGRGESFSPTDLLATALGACMATVMGIVARRKDIDLSGMRIHVRKTMSADAPRRISRLEADIIMPISQHHPDSRLLEAAALSCPVHHSLHPDIEIKFNWEWSGGPSPAPDTATH